MRERGALAHALSEHLPSLCPPQPISNADFIVPVEIEGTTHQVSGRESCGADEFAAGRRARAAETPPPCWPDSERGPTTAGRESSRSALDGQRVGGGRRCLPPRQGLVRASAWFK